MERVENKKEESTMNPHSSNGVLILLILLICLLSEALVVSQTFGFSGEELSPLGRAKIYLAAGDYRRAVEACQEYIDRSPSVEAYVYLTYVYHAMDGYLEWLATRDEWGKVGQLSLSMVDRGTMDLVDPPDLLSRMAKELLHEGLRQQFDITASMANRLDKARVDHLWQEQAAWQKARGEGWWSGPPEQWQW